MVTRKFAKEVMWMDLSEWAQTVKIFVLHMEAHLRASTAGKVNYQMDKMMLSELSVTFPSHCSVCSVDP